MPSAEMNKSSTKGGTSVMTPCANNVQLADILFILHGSAELKPRKQLHHCGFPLGRPTLAVPPAPLEAEMSCHSPLVKTFFEGLARDSRIHVGSKRFRKQLATRGQKWDLGDAAFAWPASRDKRTKGVDQDGGDRRRRPGGDRGDLADVAADR